MSERPNEGATFGEPTEKGGRRADMPMRLAAIVVVSLVVGATAAWLFLRETPTATTEATEAGVVSEGGAEAMALPSETPLPALDQTSRDAQNDETGTHDDAAGEMHAGAGATQDLAPFPDRAERVVLTHHIPGADDGCQRIDPNALELPAQAALAMRCDEGNGIAAEYLWFHHEETVGDFMTAVRGIAGVSFEQPGCESEGEGSEFWFKENAEVGHEIATDPADRGDRGGRQVGRVICYERAGQSWIVWSDDSTNIVARARVNDSDHTALFEWWANDAGPSHPLRGS